MTQTADRQLTVLLIDDDESTRFFVRTAFESFGFRLVEADCGERGLQLLREAAPDLVLVDYKMLGMDGIECCRLIRQCWSGPVFMLSGREDPLLPQQALQAGADKFFRKPTYWCALASAAADWLKRNRAAAAFRPVSPGAPPAPSAP